MAPAGAPRHQGKATTITDYFDTLHAIAGRPSSRALARRTGISHTHVNQMLNGGVVPSWELTKRFVENLDGDPALAAELWRRAYPRKSRSVTRSPQAPDETVQLLRTISAQLALIITHLGCEQPAEHG
jgi:transcriptional regulator with XRE-family HTH domain